MSPMDAIPQASSRKPQATSLTPGLDAFREAVALVLTTLAGHSEPLARDAAALSGMAGDVMGNRHAMPVGGGRCAGASDQEQLVPWCEACRSFHAPPRDLAHYLALQCKAIPVPVDLTNRVCAHCGCTNFHQPQGRSTMIECNRCGTQCEGGAQHR